MDRIETEQMLSELGWRYSQPQVKLYIDAFEDYPKDKTFRILSGSFKTQPVPFKAIDLIIRHLGEKKQKDAYCCEHCTSTKFIQVPHPRPNISVDILPALLWPKITIPCPHCQNDFIYRQWERKVDSNPYLKDDIISVMTIIQSVNYPFLEISPEDITKTIFNISSKLAYYNQ